MKKHVSSSDRQALGGQSTQTPARSRRITNLLKQPVREPDLPLAFLAGHALPNLGSGLAAPPALDEPPSDEDALTRNLRIPVFQWEIDPTDAERCCGSTELMYLGWTFRMWWETHPEGLVYASIQATHSSREEDWQGGWNFPPVRALAVNLVYDERRRGILSIHGPVKNFRPFIEAFLLGFGLGPAENADQERAQCQVP